jgi:hypothetical protein
MELSNSYDGGTGNWDVARESVRQSVSPSVSQSLQDRLPFWANQHHIHLGSTIHTNPHTDIPTFRYTPTCTYIPSLQGDMGSLLLGLGYIRTGKSNQKGASIQCAEPQPTNRTHMAKAWQTGSRLTEMIGGKELGAVRDRWKGRHKARASHVS